MRVTITGPEPDREAIAAMTELDHIRARAYPYRAPRGYWRIDSADLMAEDRRRLLEMLDEAHETIRALLAAKDDATD